MHTEPKGYYKKDKPLKNGTVATYYYHRATKTRLEGEPGSPEFEGSLAAAERKEAAESAERAERAKKQQPQQKPKTTPPGSWGAVVDLYLQSPGYRDLAPATKLWYDRAIERASGWGPRDVKEIRRADVIMMRNIIAIDSNAEANKFVIVVSAIMTHAVELEFRDGNPIVKIERLAIGEHRPWTENEVATVPGVIKSEGLRRAIKLALYTGQRASDCVKMTWGDYDGSGINVVQEKTGKKLWVPAHKALRRELEVWRRDGTPTLLVNAYGREWPVHSFCTAIGDQLRQLRPAIKGLVFHGLRKTACVRLAEVGCSEHEISSITGQSEEMVRHYTKEANQKVLASEAMRKLELVHSGD